MRRRGKAWLLTAALCPALSGCDMFADDPVSDTQGQRAERAETAATDDAEIVAPVTEQIGTPMEERVATLGFLNKRNGLTRDVELRPGQSMRIGRAIVRLRACERTAPWELTPEQGAFVQLLVNDRRSGDEADGAWRRVFSGWLFKESPSLNVVEHPIYDVWIKSCAMSFPGEGAAPSEGGADSSASSAPNDGDVVPEPAPTT